MKPGPAKTPVHLSVFLKWEPAKHFYKIVKPDERLINIIRMRGEE
jgi:hypothetical protein